VVHLLYKRRFEPAANSVLGFIPATALLAQQYVASMSVASFCASYSYMNAGRHFRSGGASCSNFGNLYVPTTSLFRDSVKAMVEGSYGATPSSVEGLSNNLKSFASIVQSKSCHFGTDKGVIFQFSGEIILAKLPSDDSTTGFYYGNLLDGSIRFSLTPSSLLLKKNKNPFNIVGANPRVVNVQAYWRGVTSTSVVS
jgi:hypothetical protein